MLKLLRSHTSVRKYKNEPISDEIFHDMLEAAQHVSSSKFVQAYSVIHVKDEEKRKKLGELSRNEKQYNSAALPLIICADLNRLGHANQMHGKEIKSGSLENFMVATIDASLFAQNFVVAAESKGYGICYIGGIRNNLEEISELFNLPDNVIPLFGLTVGVPDEKNEVKPRLPIENILHIDSYNEEKYEKLLPEYDHIIQEYYNQRSTNQKNITWTESMASFLSVHRRPDLIEYILSKGFLKDEFTSKNK